VNESFFFPVFSHFDSWLVLLCLSPLFAQIGSSVRLDYPSLWDLASFRLQNMLPIHQT
jgi:hypothetical protein